MTTERVPDPWQDYRKRRRWARLAFLLVPCALSAGTLWSTTVTALLVVISGAACISAVRFVESWQCPRCGRAFFRRGRTHNSFAKRCMHCALPKWTHPDSMPNAADAPLPNRASWV